MEWFNQVDAQYKSELKGMADAYFARFEAALERMRADLLKWMFIYWTGSILATAALVLMAVRLSR